MDCKQIQNENIAQRYRDGQLGAELTEAYEQHYFECDRCFADLQLGDQFDEDLRTHGKEIFAGEIAAERAGGRARARPGWLDWLRPGWASGAVVVAASVAVVLLVTVLQPDDGSRQLRNLWTPTPHPYVPADLRELPGDGEFQAAMESYEAGQFAQAVAGLQKARDLAPEDPVIRFYLGVSSLMIDRPRPAIEELERAVSIEPASPLYRWYLALAHLEAGEREPVEARLQEIAAAGGEYSAPAQELLEKLTDLE